MFRDNTPGFVELTAFQAGISMVGVRRANGNQPAQSMRSEFVSGNYFSMFGIGAYAGRVVTPDDDRKGASPVAVISYRAWRETFGADPSVVGGAFVINDQPFTIIGVAPPGFFGDRLINLPAFWIPIADEPFIDGPNALIGFPQQEWLDLIGRISPQRGPKANRCAPAGGIAAMAVEPHRATRGPAMRDLIPKQTLRLSPGGGAGTPEIVGIQICATTTSPACTC